MMASIVNTRVCCADVSVSAIEVMGAAIGVKFMLAASTFAPVLCAIVSIVAVFLDKHTAKLVVTFSHQTSIAVVAHETMCATTGNSITLPHVAKRVVSFAALHGAMHTAADQL